MGSNGLNITACTGAVWAEMSDSGPRWGVEVEVDSFRLLEVSADGRRVVGASGAEEVDGVQMPILSSWEAERMRFEGPCTSMKFMYPLCP